MNPDAYDTMEVNGETLTRVPTGNMEPDLWQDADGFARWDDGSKVTTEELYKQNRDMGATRDELLAAIIKLEELATEHRFPAELWDVFTEVLAAPEEVTVLADVVTRHGLKVA